MTHLFLTVSLFVNVFKLLIQLLIQLKKLTPAKLMKNSLEVQCGCLYFLSQHRAAPRPLRDVRVKTTENSQNVETVISTEK